MLLQQIPEGQMSIESHLNHNIVSLSRQSLCGQFSASYQAPPTASSSSPRLHYLASKHHLAFNPFG